MINRVHVSVRQISCQVHTALGPTSCSIFVAQSRTEEKNRFAVSLSHARRVPLPGLRIVRLPLGENSPDHPRVFVSDGDQSFVIPEP